MAGARAASPVRMRPAIACPMILRVKQSMTTARWADPCQAGICVMSPARFIPGAVAVKSRRSRPGRPGRSGAGVVVPARFPGWSSDRTLGGHDSADRAG